MIHHNNFEFDTCTFPIRRGIHVGNKDYNDVSEKVYAYLQKDIPKTVRPWLETLLDANYKVLIYR